MLLSHYTNRVGLEGIARTGELWATSFLHLNDNSEYFYAWQAIQKGAMDLFIKSMPPGLIQENFDTSLGAEASTQQFKSLVRSGNGMGHMYVLSFARSATEDHERRGILTLWDRYTNHEGYCIQFAESDIRKMMDGEIWKGSYAVFSLSNVQYGVDVNARDYNDLCFQLAQQYIVMAARARPAIRFDPDFEKMWAESYLHQKLMEYCATHKDPCYEDEREVRIIAFPADKTIVRPFTGVAGIKEVHKRDNGKQYIRLGEYWTPGIRPRRIIVGTKADPDISSVLANYTPPPAIAHANLPIA